MTDPEARPAYPSLEASRKILREASPEDFDGHTSFQDMTIEQRIQWASLSAIAVWKARGESGHDGSEL